MTISPDGPVEDNKDYSHDIFGREWAKLSETKIGDILSHDDGFDCLGGERGLDWGKATVIEINGELAIPCNHGAHFLKGQADDGDHLMGLYKGIVGPGQ